MSAIHMQQIRISHKGVFCRRKLLLQTSSGGRPYLAHSPLAYCQKRYRQDPECLPQRTAKVVAAAGAFLLAVAFLAIALSPASAEADSGREGQMTRVPSTAGEGPLPIPYQGTPKTALKIKFMVGGASHSLPRDTKDSSLGREGGSNIAAKSSAESSANQEGLLSVREQVAEVMRINESAKQAAQDGQFEKALQDYTSITRRFGDLAITNYARLGRAFMLYQTGNASEAILELQDLEVSLRGFAEVHAALASIVYSERPAEIAYAEQQFDLASEFDGRYLDVAWVGREKRWPPAMLTALDNFVNLR